MNYDFIERAEKITSFNITTADLLSLDYKKEIRHLFGKHFFPTVELTGVPNIDQEKINTVIADMKHSDRQMFKQLHNYNLKGVGPGEMTLYCVVDSVRLGGGSSSGIDVIADCGEYEVKAVAVSSDNVASNFKLGGTVSLHGLQIELDSLREELKLEGKRTEVPKSVINTMRVQAPDEFGKIEKRFAEITCDYFGSHKTIFMNHNSSIEKIGYVQCIKEVKLEDVSIERITSGTIKPAIKL